MKATKLLSIIALICFGSSLHSCFSDKDNKQTATSNIGGLFSAVVDRTTGDITLYENTSFTIMWDYTNATANVTMQGMRLPGSMTYPKISFNDVPWRVNSKGWMDITLTDATPSGVTTGSLVFNRFNFQLVNRSFNNLQFPSCLNISYTVNNEYNVYVRPTQLVEVGSTKITNPEGQVTEYNTADRPFYYFVFDPQAKSSFMVIQNATLPDNPKTMTNIKVKSMPFSMTPSGQLVATATECTVATLPSNAQLSDAGTPKDNLKVTDFYMHYDPDFGVIMNFNYVVIGKDGAPDATHRLDFETKYPTASGGSAQL